MNKIQIRSFIANHFIPQFVFSQTRVRLAVIFYNSQPIAGANFDLTNNYTNEQLQAMINSYPYYTGLTNPAA
jgi:hypothetical protein